LKSNNPIKTKKAMKKTIKIFSIVALVAMGAVLAGCAKVESTETPENQKNDNVVTLTTTVGFAETKALAIDYGAKTLTKTFAAGDQIAVIYENTSDATVKAVSEALTAGGKSATFTVTLVNPKENGSVTYIYPAAMAGDDDVDYTKLASQDGTLATIASNLDLAVFDGSLSGTALPASASLENKLALIAYTLKDADGTNDITGTITGMTVSDGTNSYSITRAAAAGPIYVAIRPTSGADIEYTATDDSKNYTKSVTGKTYAAGEFYQLGLRMAEAASVPEGAISGVFSVSATKKVYFAKGNLTYNSDTWSFLENSWTYNTNPSKVNKDNGSQHFNWGVVFQSASSGESAVVDDITTDLGAGWRGLSYDEWRYLLGLSSDKRTVEWHHYAKIKGDKRYLLIFPDSFKDTDWNESTMGSTKPTNFDNTEDNDIAYTEANFTAMQNAGIVILPAAGYYNYGEWNDVDDEGYYWSSTSNGASDAYYLSFRRFNVDMNYYDKSDYYYSVRLVQNI